MPQQPELISPPLPASPAPEATPASGGSPQPPLQPEYDRIPPWLIRAELFVRVTLRICIGLAVSLAPWTPWLWDQNPLFVQFPTLSIYAANGAVRGIVSGLGLLNMWIASRDAIRYRSR
jgi:hypothetical protein